MVQFTLANSRALIWVIGLLALSCATASAQDPEDPGTPAVYLEAQRAEARGEHQQAESLYDQALSVNPAFTPALLARARMRSWLERFDEAITDYREVLKRQPDDAQALSGLAWTLAWSGKFDEARSTFEYLARIEPYYLDAQKGLAYVSLWRGNADDARRQFEELAREDQGNADYVLAIGQAAYLQGDLPAAENAFAEALRLKPDLEAARLGLQSVAQARIEKRPAITLLYGRSESGDQSNSGIRMAQISKQINRNLRLWINHDRGVGFDGFSTDRRARDSATTTVGGFFNYHPRMAARVEAGIRDLVDETQPVFSAEQVFFLKGGTTPKVGIWIADGDEATQWVANISVHRWLGSRFAIEPTLYFGDDGASQETRVAALATYTTPQRIQFGLGVALGTKDTPMGNLDVERFFGNASIPLGSKATLLFYGWRESTDGFDSSTVLAAGVNMYL